MAKVLQIMIFNTFKIHHYKHNRKIYKQKAGGPIGLKATGYVARLTMNDWIIKFREKLEFDGVIIYMLKKYVDDVLVVCENFKLGTRKVNGLRVWKSEYEEEDKSKGVTTSQNMMRYLKTV